MEINQLIPLIKKNALIIIIFAAIGAVTAATSANFFSSGFNHQRLYFLTSPNMTNQITDNPNSESYLLQEKSRNFTDSAIAILDSPDFKAETLDQGDSLQVRKVAPQVIRLNLISASPDNNNSKLDNVISEFNTKIQQLTKSTSSVELKPVGGLTPPSYSALSKKVLFAFGAVLGTAFALLVIGLKNYYKI